MTLPPAKRGDNLGTRQWPSPGNSGFRRRAIRQRVSSKEKSMDAKLRAASLVAAATAIILWSHASAQSSAAGEVTFARDIAPILQRSCQQCHHADGVAPMSLVTYDEVRPWARSIKTRTALRSQRGA